MKTWKRSKLGIYTSACRRWSACNVGPRNAWRLTDRRTGKERHYHSLQEAKAGAVLLEEAEEQETKIKAFEAGRAK